MKTVTPSPSTNFTPVAKTGASTRRMTLNDVAQEAGVSPTTVSFVLTGREGVRVPSATRQRILEAAEKVGYRPNALGKALQSGRIDTIGIIAPTKLMTSPPGTPGAVYFKDLVLAVAAAAFEAGLNPMFLKDTPSHKISLADLSDRRVDGVILFTKINVQKFLQDAESSRVPCVTVGSGLGTYQVHTNNFEGGLIATQHLLALGHRRVSYLGFRGDSLARRSRLAGYQKALERAGITPNAAWEILGDEPGEHLAISLRALLSGPDRPTAMFCYNDELAVWLLAQCRRIGVRIPEDLSVVGFDNNVLSVTTLPSLTTIQSPVTELAKVAIELLQTQIRGEMPDSDPVFVSPHLVERESTCIITES